MKFNYDKVADAIYLAINRGKIKKTIEMNDGVILDVGTKGKIIGIEILNFSYQQKKRGAIRDFLKNGVPVNASYGTLAVA